MTVDHAEAARWFEGAPKRERRVRVPPKRLPRHRRGVAANERNAVEAFRVAAASGHAGAALDYGHCLMRARRRDR